MRPCHRDGERHDIPLYGPSVSASAISPKQILSHASGCLCRSVSALVLQYLKLAKSSKSVSIRFCLGMRYERSFCGRVCTLLPVGIASDVFYGARTHGGFQPSFSGCGNGMLTKPCLRLSRMSELPVASEFRCPAVSCSSINNFVLL